jgi:copper chaperone CopZ
MNDIVAITGHKEGNVQIYGEWFGGNIQSGVGVNGLPKSFMVFGIRVSSDAESIDWQPCETFTRVFGDKKYAEHNIYTKYDFPTHYVTVDFERPELSQNAFVELCAAVEDDCPVARFFKPDAPVGSLVGEGVVITPIQTQEIGFDIRSNIAKVKGEKHSVSKVKTTATLDPEKIASNQEFVDKVLTENRLKQGVEKMKELGYPLEMTSTGHFIKWVMSDIFREEADTMVVSKIEPKDVNGIISTTAKKFWINVVNAN